MRPPGLIDDQGLASPVTDLGDALDVRAGAVGGRTDDERTGRVGVFVPGRGDLLGRGRMGQVKLGIPARLDPPGLDPPGLDATEDLAGGDRLVGVAADQEVVCPARDRHHGRLERQ